MHGRRIDQKACRCRWSQLSALGNERTVCDTLRLLARTQVIHDLRLSNEAASFSAPTSPYCLYKPKPLGVSLSTRPP